MAPSNHFNSSDISEKDFFSDAQFLGRCAQDRRKSQGRLEFLLSLTSVLAPDVSSSKTIIVISLCIGLIPNP